MNDHHHCPTCHELIHLLVHAEPDVVRRGLEALKRGPGWGVLVAPADQIQGETDEEKADVEQAHAAGYYVGVVPVDGLIRMLTAQVGTESRIRAAVITQLLGDPPEGQVHVLGMLDDCAAAVTARASPELVAARDRTDRRMRRIQELLSEAESEILCQARERSLPHDSVFVVEERDGCVCVGLHGAPEAIASLPPDGLDPDDGLRLASRLNEPLAKGSIRVVAHFDGHLALVQVQAVPGCLSIG